MSAALLGREAIDITASLADAAAPLAMGILEFTNPSDLHCRHGGLLAAGSLRTRTGRPSATRRAENKGKLTKHLQRPQPPNGRLMLKRSACPQRLIQRPVCAAFAERAIQRHLALPFTGRGF